MGECQYPKVAVVGAGPRGLSVVERLAANAAASRRRVTVHVVDPHLGAGGRVWRRTQPRELLMNTVASQVTMFTDRSVRCAGPIRPGPSLYEWARAVAHGGPPSALPADPLPEWARAEAARLGPNAYPTRAFYGHYLVWVLDHVRRTAPERVAFRLHRATAVRLTEDEDGTQLLGLDDGTRLRVDRVVLAQGHLDTPLVPGTEEAALRDHASAPGAPGPGAVGPGAVGPGAAPGYLPPASPAETDLSGVAPGEPVALRGLGLNFFDYLALLTVGRDGEFHRERGRLRYRPSGREPRLYAGSRRGVPYHARGENQKGPFGRHWPVILTQQRIAALRERRLSGEPIEFARHVWPLIDREVTAAYLYTLVSQRRHRREAEAFLRSYAGLPVDGPLDERVLRRFGIGRDERWDWNRVLRPYGDRTFRAPADYRNWLLAYLRRDLAEARRGNVRGPLKAALDVLRDLRNEVRLVVDHAGITGESYECELRSWYTPLNAFVSIGPPPARIEELIALIEAGVVEVLGPGMTVVPLPGGFGVGSAAVPGSALRVTTLIEARLPEVDIRRTADPLVRDLMARGACRPYPLPSRADGQLPTGGLAVTPRPCRLVDAAGRPHPSRFAFGVPTETVHWATAAGIRPGVDSVILGDADAIARACLAAGPPGRLPPPEADEEVHLHV
ncbi:FAD/NAD(P)-binding protein [Streptomyces boncukensis]|uniref:FAD-binding protein n=1 Tax=Streptomyces boncukensis TaxID=2711219 RepID=A0A6G4WZL2_9ACTN|nr:FAD/NAD(P)-binding protein [Streptomyces boncukensis]NGO70047.1 FAD-binding protein [Streptomyces boncukensis]